MAAEPIIVDHTCTDITFIPQSAIEAAKANLHIAYGHTSHGSQITTGMAGLVGFANGGGLGLALPADIFDWNNGGTGGGRWICMIMPWAETWGIIPSGLTTPGAI